MTVDELLLHLSGVRPSRGGWVACCPAHEDRNPSLSVHEVDGVILLHCFAGCSFKDILRALGLEEQDFFPQSRHGHSRALVCYDYTDEDSNLLYQVVRFEPKDFRVRRPDGMGGWIWNLDGVRRVLYDLPQVVKARSVLVCEGEKDCQAAQELGIVATCNPGGAGKWRAEYDQFLTGKRIVVVPDGDAPGLFHAHDICRSLIGKAESLILISLAPHKDISDWLANGGSRAALLKLIEDAPELRQEDVSAWSNAGNSNSPGQEGFRVTTLRDLMNEPEERVSWLLGGILPAGGLGLLAAKPKVGKSTLARCLALAVSRGDEFLNRKTVQGPVVYLALEEKRAEVRRHFRELGANGTEPIYIHCAAAPQHALPALLKLVKQYKPVLVIVDPVLRMMRVRDANDYALVSNALEPVMSLAREYSAHLLLVYHLGKGERAEATDSILGSTAFFAAVDTALIMKRSDRYRTIQSRQRYGEDLSETVLEFDRDRRAVSLGLERSEADARVVAEEILKFLVGAADAKGEPEIKQAVEGRNAAKQQALRQLVDQGKVIRSGSGKRGDPYRYSFSFSCTPHIPGTTVQETEKEADTRINAEGNLVPEKPDKSFLVPENEKPEIAPQMRPENPVENSPKKPDSESQTGMVEFEI